jgi:hypothetical protein
LLRRVAKMDVHGPGQQELLYFQRVDESRCADCSELAPRNTVPGSVRQHEVSATGVGDGGHLGHRGSFLYILFWRRIISGHGA